MPIRISGGASHLAIRRPAETGVDLGVAGGIATLHLDDQSFGALGGGAQLHTGDVTRGVPHYELTVAGDLGYREMVLDVMPSRVAAIALYRSLGFTDAPLFHDYAFGMVGLSREL